MNHIEEDCGYVIKASHPEFQDDFLIGQRTLEQSNISLVGRLGSALFIDLSEDVDALVEYFKELEPDDRWGYEVKRAKFQTTEN